jgi:hypothetical protein
MRTPRLRFPSPALIVACLALFAALGGSTYAATHISASAKIHFSNAALKNGWTNHGPPFALAGYAKDSVGIVHLRGALNYGGSDTGTFRLPRGLRPSHELDLPIFASGLANVATVTIYPSGNVAVIMPNTDSFALLDGVSFAAGE